MITTTLVTETIASAKPVSRKRAWKISYYDVLLNVTQFFGFSMICLSGTKLMLTVKWLFLFFTLLFPHHFSENYKRMIVVTGWILQVTSKIHKFSGYYFNSAKYGVQWPKEKDIPSQKAADYFHGFFMTLGLIFFQGEGENFYILYEYFETGIQLIKVKHLINFARNFQ